MNLFIYSVLSEKEPRRFAPVGIVADIRSVADAILCEQLKYQVLPQHPDWYTDRWLSLEGGVPLPVRGLFIRVVPLTPGRLILLEGYAL